MINMATTYLKTFATGSWNLQFASQFFGHRYYAQEWRRYLKKHIYFTLWDENTLHFGWRGAHEIYDLPRPYILQFWKYMSTGKFILFIDASIVNNNNKQKFVGKKCTRIRFYFKNNCENSDKITPILIGIIFLAWPTHHVDLGYE